MLVQAARDYGYTLLSRSPHQCSLVLPDGTIVRYDVLHMLEFDSNRKCMSIIVREQGHSEVILYSKGADSVIFRNLTNIVVDLSNKRASSLISREKSHSSAHASLSASMSAPSTLVAPSVEKDLSVNVGGRTGSPGKTGSPDRTGCSGRTGSPGKTGSPGNNQAEGETEDKSSKPSKDTDYGSRKNDGGIQQVVETQATSKRTRQNLMEMTLMRDISQQHLDGYAKLGLRTLCMAKRVILGVCSQAQKLELILCCSGPH